MTLKGQLIRKINAMAPEDPIVTRNVVSALNGRGQSATVARAGICRLGRHCSDVSATCPMM